MYQILKMKLPKFSLLRKDAQFPDHLKDPELFESIKISSLFMFTLELGQKTTGINVASNMVNILLRKQSCKTA